MNSEQVKNKKQIFLAALLPALLLLVSCSKSMVLAGRWAADAVPGSISAAVRDSLPDNGLCVSLRMIDGTQQLIYTRIHPTVQRQPRQMVVSSLLTSVSYDRNDVVYHQPGKALLAGTSTAGLPSTVLSAGIVSEQILFFGLPRNSHLTIMTDTGIQWRDQDVETGTYALVLSDLPRGRYLVTMNSITFHVELR